MCVVGCSAAPATRPAPPRQLLEPRPPALTTASALPDADGDKIADAYDACPNEPEPWNGIMDDDGCPDRVGESYPPFHALVATSPDHTYELHVDKSDGGPAWLEVTNLTSHQRVYRVRSHNRFAPRLALISDHGRVITLDEHYRPRDEHMVVIYDPAGAVVADLSAEQALQASDLARTGDHSWYSASPSPALAGDTLHVTTPWRAVIDLDLVTGAQRRDGREVAMPTPEERLAQYFDGSRPFDSIMITLLHRRAQGYVCHVSARESWCSAASSAQPVNDEHRSLRGPDVRAALHAAVPLARCMIHPDAAGVQKLGALDEGLVMVVLHDAGHDYNYDLRADAQPACRAVLPVLEALAPSLPVAPPPPPPALADPNADIDGKNAASFARALRARKLAPTHPVEVARHPVAGPAASSADHVEVTVPVGTPASEIDFVENRAHDVWHVLRKPRVIKRVPRQVCFAGPARPPRTAVEVVEVQLGADQRYRGELTLAYDAIEIIPQNTCK
jgi:hypothetical protein